MPPYLTFTTAKVKIKLPSYFFPNSHGLLHHYFTIFIPITSPPTAPKPAKKPKNNPLRWRTIPIENIDLKELPFTGNPPLGQLPIQEPIDYFGDIIGDELMAHIVSESNIYASHIDINKPLN